MSVKIQTIFCPVDAANESAESLVFPLALARDFNAKVICCYCAPGSPDTDIKATDARKLNELIETAREKFRRDAGDFSPETNVQILNAEKDIAEKIVSAAAQADPDLIVMPPSRHPLVKSLSLSSNAENVIRRAPCPVLVAERGKMRLPNNLAAPVFRRILAAHDFSDDSEIALQYAAYLAEKYESQLDLLHVLDEPARDNTEFAWADETIEHLYHQSVNRLQTAAQTGGYHPSVKHTIAVRWGKAYREILKYAEENEIDLIAMGKRGADSVPKSLFGSNVDRVLRQTTRAVLVAHPKKLSNQKVKKTVR